MELAYRFCGLGLIFTGIFLAHWFRQRMRAKVDAAYPHCRLATMAAALGQNVVRGSPTKNLMLGPDENPMLSILGIRKHGTDVQLEARRGAQLITFVLKEQGMRIRAREITLVDNYEFRSHLCIYGVPLIAPFEIWTTSPQAHMSAQPVLRLPVVCERVGPTTHCFVASQSTEIAYLIAGWLSARMGSIRYVHIIGTRGQVRFVFTHSAFYTMIPQLTQLQDDLWDLTRKIRFSTRP